jgi:hypothetical protein
VTSSVAWRDCALVLLSSQGLARRPIGWGACYPAFPEPPRMVSRATESFRPLRRVEYDRLVALGTFDGERIELIRGALRRMSPIGPPHTSTVDRLTRLLVLALADFAWVRVQGSFAADDSPSRSQISASFRWVTTTPRTRARRTSSSKSRTRRSTTIAGRRRSSTLRAACRSTGSSTWSIAWWKCTASPPRMAIARSPQCRKAHGCACSRFPTSSSRWTTSCADRAGQRWSTQRR